MGRIINLDGMEIEWLGHAGFRFKRGKLVVYTDPFKIQGGDPADLILITHDHYDHCDRSSVESVRKQDTVIVGPAAVAEKLHDVKVVKPGQLIVEKSVEIKPVHAYNTNKPFHPKGSGVGYVFTMGDKTIYHAGDTDFVPEMKQLGKVDVAILPCGGTYTMNAREAAEAANAIRPDLSIPMHWGSIVGSKKDAEEFRKLVRFGRVEIL
jgi:L-ascorbate metabolism protein UlaG (beta-lactamase superfamily)